jgi:hypothetical protein
VVNRENDTHNARWIGFLVVVNYNLRGTIPDEIQGIDVLKRLAIVSNWLNGPLPFDALTNTMIVKRPLFAAKLGLVAPVLPSLLDEHSNASGGVHSSIFPALRSLSVYQNQLTGTIPSSLGLLVAIQMLEVALNRLTGELPSIVGNLKSLSTLEFSENHFTGTLPSSLGNLTTLQHMSLSENLFSGRLPSSLGQLTALTSLDVSVNIFTGKLPSSLGNLTPLTVLLVDTNSFT